MGWDLATCPVLPQQWLGQYYTLPWWSNSPHTRTFQRTRLVSLLIFQSDSYWPWEKEYLLVAALEVLRWPKSFPSVSSFFKFTQNVLGLESTEKCPKFFLVLHLCPLSLLEGGGLHCGGRRPVWAVCQVCRRPAGEVFWGCRSRRETRESFWISRRRRVETSRHLQTAQTDSVRARILCPTPALPSTGGKNYVFFKILQRNSLAQDVRSNLNSMQLVSWLCIWTQD